MKEQGRYRRNITGEQLAAFLETVREGGAGLDALQFLCIGTDRSSGDALGPLVGTLLREAGYPHVIGTLQSPCDSSNIGQRLQELGEGRTVIAIDACLGQASSIGMFQISNQPIEPGKSVGKKLPPVGDYSIAAIVNQEGARTYSILQHTPLGRVWDMAHAITGAVRMVFPLDRGEIGLKPDVEG
ncbi:spore protease YyaC [Paenibacillus sp. y28]|uniref:spore protease YyaC n=1 Tax=Paenibacillus sp. y28 TaxID=3129110 RepID=UPI003018101F